jgi:hypothetical protein
MCLSLQRITGVAPHAQQSCVTKNASSACEFQRGTTPVGRRTERNSKMISGDEVPQAERQSRGQVGRCAELSHKAFKTAQERAA